HKHLRRRAEDSGKLSDNPTRVHPPTAATTVRDPIPLVRATFINGFITPPQYRPSFRPAATDSFALSGLLFIRRDGARSGGRGRSSENVVPYHPPTIPHERVVVLNRPML